MARRRSIYRRGFRHKNPIPNACRIGNLVVSGGINEVDPATGKVPAALEAQCALMFAHMREIVETASGKRCRTFVADRSAAETSVTACEPPLRP
jgi:2-iminobutanoate/2-iminopropanoate deaminase